MTQPLRLWTGTVLEEWIDYNRHMSEGFYGLVFGHASDEYLLRMGFDAAYREQAKGAFYTVETHIVFLDELPEAAPLAIDTTVAGADAKRVHLFHELRRATDETLAATQEVLMLHGDTVQDKVAPMRDDLLAVVAADAEAHADVLAADQLGRSVRPVPRG